MAGKRIGVIIPARGGSKGIPNKNLQRLGGYPLIHYPLDLARKISDEVVVTSDSGSILYEAVRAFRDINLIAHLRDDSLAQDDTLLDPVLVDAAKRMESDIIVTLLPTCPFLRLPRLQEGLARFKSAPVIAAVLIHEVIWDLGIVNEGDATNLALVAGERVNRQRAQKMCIESGAFSICSRERLIDSGTRYYETPDLSLVSTGDAFDIDTLDDLQFARLLYGI